MPLATVIVPPGDFVNVRRGPGTNFPIVGGLTGNDIATIMSRTSDGKWLEIRVNGRTGWVSARVVRVTGTVTNVPPISAADANAGTNAAGELVDTHGRYVYIHGTNHEERLGTPFSGGCIEMNNLEIVALFEEVRAGDLVWIED